MNRFILLCCLLLFFSCTTTKKVKTNYNPSSTLPFELDKDLNTTATYQEAIDFYTALAAKEPEVQVKTFGETDAGKPLHLVLIDKTKKFELDPAKRKQAVLFVNNGIHPGEPLGIDASMIMVRNWIKKKSDLPENVLIAIIPIYNIGGALNRTSSSRANQMGPKAYGFRGNSRNLDLNRDFIKCDSKNASTFAEIYHYLKPEVFIDNHTSNGADYPYVMTLIETLPGKLETGLSNYLTTSMLPNLYKQMEESGYEMCPYVYARTTPDEGIMAFLDLPRYSSGYTTLFNTIGFIPEAHMLKPYKQRVESDIYFMLSVVDKMEVDHQQIIQLKKQADQNVKTQKTFDINWKLDRDNPSQIRFKGYESSYKKSEITGKPRLYYDRDKTWEKDIPYYNSYKTTETTTLPNAFIIPQAWHEVIDRLKENDIELSLLKTDVKLEVESTYLSESETGEIPWEGHYIHRNVKTETKKQAVQFYSGDVVIRTNQTGNRFLAEILEPRAPDSYFAWNFFDEVFQQKEYFSPYVFEDLAVEILKENPAIKQALEEKRAADDDFAKSTYAQLDFIYKRSKYYEPTHKRIPIFRYNGTDNLPTE